MLGWVFHENLSRGGGWWSFGFLRFRSHSQREIAHYFGRRFVLLFSKVLGFSGHGGLYCMNETQPCVSHFAWTWPLYLATEK